MKGVTFRNSCNFFFIGSMYNYSASMLWSQDFAVHRSLLDGGGRLLQNGHTNASDYHEYTRVDVHVLTARDRPTVLPWPHHVYCRITNI